ncbi:hypothetical protein AMS58_13230 [Pseudoalteromonas porphyrae]|uniref:ATP-binding protein n=1 Tax=Pseudoalteromonas porphyrae TaxID=187330 RepID=UPI0006BB38A8|nr:ATP-binding protein [Pseudoalteromonas porphyrae]KPH94260.1 hypothetical protein AMS58_13230 [Pseudoalteromonas porphyrae]
MLNLFHKANKLFGKKVGYLFPVFIIVILLVFTITVVVFETQLSKSINSSIEKNLTDKSHSVYTQIQKEIEGYRNDLRFLFTTPPISGLARAANHNGIDPLDNTTSAQWKQRLETIFVAFIQNNSEYEQLRVISAQKEGIELVRVDRTGGGITVMMDAELQKKGDRDYAKASNELSNGEIYMSNISLNREFGKIDFPYRPMLRLSIPIFDDDMQRFGFVIVNINASHLFKSLLTIVNEPNQLALVDNEGYFLLHPNKELMFSKDLASDLRWDTFYTLEKNTSSGLTIATPKRENKEGVITFARKIRISSDVESGYFTAYLLNPLAYVKGLESERRTSVYAFLLVVVILLLFILSVFNRSIRNTQALADARAESDAIVGGSMDAIIGITKAGIVTSWNRAACSLFGYQSNESLGKSLQKLSLFPDLKLDDLIGQLASGVHQSSLETTKKINGNIEKHLSLSLSAIIDDSGQYKGVAIIARDITIEKLAKEKIRQANADLEDKVASRTAALEKASEVKSAFISNVSHEMRTPLNGIIGTLNLVKKESLSEQQHHYLEMTEVSVNNLSVLINDILDLSKIEAGKLDLDFKAFNPVKLLESLCGSMAVKAQDKGLEFILDVIDLHCQSIVSDPHRFSQIITNLINNAIKFTPNGYIKVTAYSKVHNDKTVTIHCDIADSGVGIAEDNQNKLFNAFSQEDSSIASKYGGTGLGLSICKQLSQLLNGEISFESTKEQGSIFHFKLNLKEADSAIFAREKRLAGKSVALVVASEPLKVSLEKLVQGFGGVIYIKDEFVSLVESDNEVMQDFPDLVIIEQTSLLLKALDSRFAKVTDHFKLSKKVVVIADSGEPKPLLKYMKPLLLSKPILVSEFLHKVVNGRDNSGESKESMRRETDTKHVAEEGIAGANVLLVDDNDINAEVAKGILSVLELNFTLASNGQEAIERILEATAINKPFHCILMDCQMPILNGYDASSQIRQGKAGLLNKDLPIIAMTANAMLGERKKCLDAGMSDYITKPISAEKLIAITAKWIASTYDNSTVEPSAITFMDDNSLDNVQIHTLSWDKDAALTRLMGNKDLLIKVCVMFLERTEEKISNLKNAILANDYESSAKLSHALKGISGDVGAIMLHKIFSEIEVISLNKETDKLAALNTKIETAEVNYAELAIMMHAYLDSQ